MDEETVIDPTVDPSGGEPMSPKGQEKAKEQPVVDPKEFRAMQAQLADMRKSLEETRASERYWAERAKGGAAQDPDDEPQPDDDDDEPEVKDDKPEALVDDLSSRGIDALVKRGVLTRKQAKELIAKEVAKHTRKVVEEVVGRERTKLSTDAEIMKDYPDLRDPKSALFAKTQEIYKEVVRRNPEKANDPEALLSAAHTAKLSLRIEELESGRGTGRRAEYPEPEERNRQDRIRAQASDRGRRSSEFDDSNDTHLGDEAREVIRQMGISEDEFSDSRKRLGVVRRGR